MSRRALFLALGLVALTVCGAWAIRRSKIRSEPITSEGASSFTVFLPPESAHDPEFITLLGIVRAERALGSVKVKVKVKVFDFGVVQPRSEHALAIAAGEKAEFEILLESPGWYPAVVDAPCTD